MTHTFDEHYKNRQFSQILSRAVLSLLQMLVPCMTVAVDEISYPNFPKGFQNLLVKLLKISKYLIFLLFVPRYKDTEQVPQHNRFEGHLRSLLVHDHLLKMCWVFGGKGWAKT